MNTVHLPAEATPLQVTTGTLYGVGLGPGDPELMTVKAARILARAPVVAWFAKRGRRGNARVILDAVLSEGAEEVPLHYPVTTEIPFTAPAYATVLGKFYTEAAEALALRLSAGRDVALVCEGDPLFYGSFMHLYVRLRERFPSEIVPAVTGMAGCWSAAGVPMAWGDDVMTIVPGTLAEDDLVRRFTDADAIVVMKLGRNLDKVRRALDRAGLLDRALYVERGTMPGERIERLAAFEGPAPYFSVVLVPGEGRRP